MKAIARFVVHVFDLTEAEGASLLTVVRREAGSMRDTTTNMTARLGILERLHACRVGDVNKSNVLKPSATCGRLTLAKGTRIHDDDAHDGAGVYPAEPVRHQ